jgi:HlyD family secretion protein
MEAAFMKALFSNVKTMLSKMSRRAWIISGAVLLVVIIGLVIWGARSNRAVRFSQGQRYTVARGPLVQSIGGTGSVHASQSAVLVWQTTGKVGSVTVGIGDKVAADQVLAELAQSSLPQAVIQAAVDLVDAQAELAQATVSNTGRASAEQALATAQQALHDAQNKYDSMTFPRASDTLIKNTEADIVLAKQRVARMADTYRKYSRREDGDTDKAQALANLTDAQLSLNELVATYNWYSGTPSDLDLANAKAALAVAKAQVADAQRTLDSYTNGASSPDVVAAQAKVAIAQSNLNQARIIAPFSGIVTEADPTVGDLVASGTVAFRVDNVSHLLVDVAVSEVDINQVKEGLPVSMQFDAIPGKTYKGKVSKVNLAGEVASNAVTFTITAELTDADVQVKPGMSASVSILVKQVENALVVPNRAIRNLNGKHTVNLLQFGQIVPVEVQVGATTDTVSEILSGLKEGDTLVFTPTTSTTNNSAVGFGPGGGGGGPRIRIP